MPSYTISAGSPAYAITAAEETAQYALISVGSYISNPRQVLKKLSCRGQSALGETLSLLVRFSVSVQGALNIFHDDHQFSINASVWCGNQPVPVGSQIQVQVWSVFMVAGDLIFIEGLMHSGGVESY